MSVVSRRLSSVLLGVLTVVVIAGGFTSFERMRSWFERLDFQFHWNQGAILVDGVDPDGPAARAGIRPGDQILVVGGSPSFEVDGLKRTLRREVSPVPLVISRGDQVVTTMYEAPELKVDYRYLYKVFIGFLYLAIGLFTLFRGDRNDSLLFFCVTLLAFIVYVYSPAGKLDATYKALWLTEDFARALLPPLTLHFFLQFPRQMVRDRRVLGLIYVPPALLALATLHVLVLSRPLPGLGVAGSFALIDRWQMLHFAVYFTLAFAALTWTFRTSAAGGQRRQIQWIYLGMGLGFIPFVVLYLVPFIWRGPGGSPGWIANAALLPLALIPLAFAVSILKYKLWDVEVVIKEVLAYTVVFIFGMIGFSTVNLLLTRVIEEQMALERNFLAFASGLLIAGVLVPVKGRIETLVEMVLYRETWRHRRAMLDLGEQIATQHDPQELVRTMRERLGRAIRLERLNLYVRSGDQFVLVSGDEPLRLEIDASEVGELPVRRPLMLTQPRLPDASSFPLELLRQGYRVVFPLRQRGELLGLLLIGGRAGEEALSRDDLQLIGSLTAPLSLAIENSRLYGRLRRQFDEIRVLKEFNENIIQSSPTAIVVAAVDGTLLMANPAFWRMSELDPAVEHRLLDLFPDFEDIRRVPGSVREIRWTTPGGVEKVLTLSASPFQAPDAPSDAVVLVLTDVSETARLQEELQEKERLASLGLLAAGVAHEVNTPLTGISSYAQILLSETSIDDPHHLVLRKMEQQTFRASHLVNNLLNFAASKPRSAEPVDLSDVVRLTVSANEELLRPRKIRLETALEPGVIVRGSAFELQQVVTNLVLNARDAVSDDAGLIRISISATPYEGELRVQDNGRGIEPEMLQEIFKPLVTTRRGKGGTGLGLAIVDRIVRGHGGTVEVESRPGEGATFIVRVPLWRQTDTN